MHSAIIDVGSNTIRTEIHDVNNNESKIIHNARDFVGIIGYIENNILKKEGIEKLSESLLKMAEICQQHNCSTENIHCFATASLRNLENSREILDSIYIKSGLKVKIISGEDEVYYDLVGLMSVVDENNGIGLDLGGGSCQIFTFENKKLKDSVSLPIGSLKMYHTFKNEESAIDSTYEYVKKLLSEYSEFHNAGYGVIYAIGGSARIAEKVSSDITGKKNDGYISLENIEMILHDDYKDKVLKILEKTDPERKESLFTGCSVLKAICNHTGAKGIKVVQAGVREGYLHSEILA